MASQVKRTEVVQPVGTDVGTATWIRGMLAGLAGGLLFGIVMSMVTPAALEEAIPALVGLDGGIAGWFVHMSIAAIFGVVFAALVTRTSLSKYADSLGGMAGLGLVYGVVLWVVAASLVMPVWLDAVGFANAPAVPNFDTMSLLGHVVFGVVLGAIYPTLK